MENSFGIAHRAPGTDFRARAEEKKSELQYIIILYQICVRKYCVDCKYTSISSFKELVIEYNTDLLCLFSRITQATFRPCSRICAKFLLEHFCEYGKLLNQDSCLSQALLLGKALLLDSSMNLVWIKQDSCLSALVNTGRYKQLGGKGFKIDYNKHYFLIYIKKKIYPEKSKLCFGLW